DLLRTLRGVPSLTKTSLVTMLRQFRFVSRAVRATPAFGSPCRRLKAFVRSAGAGDLQPKETCMSSESDSSKDGRALLALWVSELSEFELMVRRAQHGFKKFAGGADRGDMELYDEEAAECARCRKVLEGLELPATASAEEARATATQALEN